ncbi:hypothetical protein OEV98_00925 [Caldibacillus lycopersici]|uniref:Flagellar hook-length control protein FliK n=1 Tax=Perspicuibacillus lycopersici TaxID=1325689 RepID=A0AAE3IU32_9BACI|nr:hypothetical protein [Perspicuibacillus lycopersici]MCU9612120.1 hypothetical protein [Perspicuibacillus lycopersici]
MNIYSVHQSKQSVTQFDKPLDYKTGQIIRGKLQSIDMFGNAVVQLGKYKRIAKIEASLDVAKQYWFQVQKQDGKLLLKVLENVHSEETLLKYFGLATSKTNKELIRQLQQWNLPLDKEVVTKVEKWVNNNNTVQTEKLFQAIRYIIQNELPLTNDVFKGIFSVWNGEKFTQLLERLSQQVNSEQMKNYEQLKLVLQSFFGNTESVSLDGYQWADWSNGKEVYKNFIQILQMLGLNEKRIGDKGNTDIQSLKQLLQELLNGQSELSEGVKQAAEQVYYRILGNQLLMNDQPPYFQWTVQLPLPMENAPMDITLQWFGKKNTNGKLDADFCQITFDLQMPTLGKTWVMMNVQNKIISLHIQSDFHSLEHIGKPMINVLKEKLEENHYHLSTVKFDRLTKSTKQQNKREDLVSFYQRGSMDVKI